MLARSINARNGAVADGPHTTPLYAFPQKASSVRVISNQKEWPSIRRENVGVVREGTYEDIRALCNEVSRGLGLVAFMSVISFFIYDSIVGGTSLGWLWLPSLTIAIVLATLVVGIPVLCLRLVMEIQRRPIGLVWFTTLKFAMTIWSLVSFVIAWRVAAAVANWMS